MPNEFNISSNDVQNGYIYKELNNRMIKLERNMQEIFNMLQKIDSSGKSIETMTNITEELEKRAKLEYVKNHVEDSVRHLNDIKKMEWDNKYELPLDGIPEDDLDTGVRRKLNNPSSGGNENSSLLKYETMVGNGYSKEFSFRHALNTERVVVNLWDAKTNELVYTDITIIDENIIKVSFLNPPRSSQYRLIIIG